MKNVKYYAGLYDADGSFGVAVRKNLDGSYNLLARATLYQKDPTVLEPIAKKYKVKINAQKDCHSVDLRGKKALNLIEHLRQHLVIKKKVAQYVEGVSHTTIVGIKAMRSELKAARLSEVPEKNFPSRKWMAGYVDGDGCITSSFRKRDGNLSFILMVTSHCTQEAGLRLMQKIFGGHITSQGDVRRWNITLSISKGKQVLEYFAQHLLMKKGQADLVLNCIRTKQHLQIGGATWEGNLKIHQQLQLLKRPATTKS